MSKTSRHDGGGNGSLYLSTRWLKRSSRGCRCLAKSLRGLGVAKILAVSDLSRLHFVHDPPHTSSLSVLSVSQSSLRPPPVLYPTYPLTAAPFRTLRSQQRPTDLVLPAMQALEHAPAHMPSNAELLRSGRPSNRTATPYRAPCECSICQTQYRNFVCQSIDEYAYVGKRNDKDAQVLLTSYMKQITQNQDFIRATLQRYGDALLDWWRTRRPSGRKAFLEQVVPQLPKTKETQVDYQGKRHTPEYNEFSDLEKLSELKQADRKINRHAFLLPYPNIDTLAKESFTLLALLHTRANARLEDWAAFDNDQLIVNWNCSFYDVEFNPGCVVLYGADYGELKKWNKESVHRGDHLGFPRAQVLLEAQATLMATLRPILENAIESIPQSPFNVRDSFVEFVSADRLSSQSSTAWSSYVHQPTSDPPRLDLHAQISDVQTRIEDIGDQLWLLQTEPVYLRRYLRVIGQTSATHAFQSSDWPTELLLLEIKALLETYWFWQGVLVELEHTKGIYDSFRDEIRPGSALPTRVETALGALEALLEQGIDVHGRQLRCLVQDRPAFSGMYNGVSDEATKSRFSELKEVSGRPEPATEHKTHRLWWCLGNLLGTYDTIGRLPYPLLLGILDDHLGAAGAGERKKMDEILYERFSDFATMIKLFEALRLHRPTYARRDSEICKTMEDRLGWRRVRLAKYSLWSDRSVLRTLKTMQNTKPPVGGKGVKWLQAFDDDHATLQAFWRSLLVDYRKWHERRDFNIEDTAYYLKALQFWESEDYRKLLEVKRQSVLSAIETRVDVGDDIAFLPLPTSTIAIPTSST